MTENNKIFMVQYTKVNGKEELDMELVNKFGLMDLITMDNLKMIWPMVKVG